MRKEIVILSTISASALLFSIGCGSTPAWVRGVAHNPYYFQGVGSSTSEQGADRESFKDIGMEISGARVRSSTEIIVTETSSGEDNDPATSLQEYTIDSTSVVIETALEKGAKVVKRWYNPAQHTYYSYSIFPRTETQARMAAHVKSIKLRSLVPGFAQFSKGHPQRGFTILGSLGLGIAGIITFSIWEDDAIFDRDNNARSKYDFDYYDDRARNFRKATIATASATIAVYVFNVFDGMFSKPTPGANYYSNIELGNVKSITMKSPYFIRYRWYF